VKKLLALAALTVGTSFASVIAMTTSGGSTSVDTGAFTLGWSFNVSGPAIMVSALGWYDAGSNGLLNPHTVGIYSSSGTLLVSATVPSGTTGTLDNGFRMVSITPFRLNPGSYVIAGFNPNSSDPFLTSTTFIAAAGITPTNINRYEWSSALAFPSQSASFSYGAANFEFTPTPEPSTLLLSLGAFAALGLKKRLSVQAESRR
jgi:hypothetical protein